MADATLRDLPNIGAVLSAQLAGIGIHTPAQLRRVGAAEAYVRLCQRSGRRLPLCYYLYSLQGALCEQDWRTLTATDKRQLREAASIRCKKTRKSLILQHD